MIATHAALALLAVASASELPLPAQPNEIRVVCSFKLRREKGHSRVCTARFNFENTLAADTPAPVPPEPNFRVRCDGETFYDGPFTAAAATTGVKLDPGMSLIAAYRGNSATLPAVYVDGLVFDQNFRQAPGDLRLDENRRLLHGFCERD